MSSVKVQPSSKRPNDALLTGVDVIGYFRRQMVLVAGKDFERLATSFASGPFTNGEARAVLGTKRQAVWVRLSALTELGLLEKRGHSYRLSAFSRDFVSALAVTLRALITGSELSSEPEIQKVIRVAAEGVEMMYAKGRLGQEDHFRYKAQLQEWTAHGR